MVLRHYYILQRKVRSELRMNQRARKRFPFSCCGEAFLESETGQGSTYEDLYRDLNHWVFLCRWTSPPSRAGEREIC
jgi:hypothetical protein